MPIQLKCICCSKEFLVKPYMAETRKYCSEACKNAHSRTVLKCEHCSGDFWVFKSILNTQRKRFCSMECRKAVMSRPKPVKVERERHIKVCKNCGVEFTVPPSRATKATYCSQKCKGSDPEYREKVSIPQRREKSNRWTGGVYENKRGYIRKRLGHGENAVDTVLHRDVVVQALLNENPSHPFLIVVNGIVRLDPMIDVHHVDRVRDNNAIENLLAVTKTAHSAIHSNGRKPHPWECWPSNPERW